MSIFYDCNKCVFRRYIHWYAAEALLVIEMLQLDSHERFSAERATEYIVEIEQENTNWLK